ncbi:MAG: MarR family transcriptional regulator [Actinomycetota bacterium]
MTTDQHTDTETAVDTDAVVDGVSELFPSARLAATGALHAASLAVARAFEQRVNAPLGIDTETADLIVRISLVGEAGLRGVDCVRQLHLTPTQVSRLADRVESRGLIERTPDPQDRRAQRLVLTEAGKQTAEAIAPLTETVIQALIFDEFDERERTVLIDLLERLTARATHLNEEAGD